MKLAVVLMVAVSAAACSPSAPSSSPTTVATAPAAATPTAAVNPPVSVTAYDCADGQTLTAAYPDADTAIVTWKDHTYTLKVARSGSGARYTGYGLQWWTKGMTHGDIAPLKAGEDIASAKGVGCDSKAAYDVEPPAPGTPGGLPDDRTPLSEAPYTATSPQGAANVVQTYYALIGEGKYAQAGKLRRDGVVFDPAPYASYHALVGGPGESEGAAGSIFIEVPVVIYGRLRSGAELHQSGKVTLRRVNDVPGATPEQLLWRIDSIALK